MNEIDIKTYEKLNRGFYERETLDVARELLGKIIVHNIEGKILAAIITETEAYKKNDKASHFYGGKKTPRTQVVFGKGGVAYVYFIYGMYHCFNVVTEKDGVPGAVLIRKIRPILGIEEMIKNRGNKKKLDINKLADGPAKLCSALGIAKNENGQDLTDDKLYIIENPYYETNQEIKVAKRINIDYAEECKDYLWRFFI